MGAIAKATKKLGGGQLLNAAIPVAFGVMEYNQNRDQGKGVISSAATALGSYAFFEAVPLLPALAITALPAIPKAAVSLGENLSAMSRNMNKGAINTPFGNATFNDSQQAYTMRQAGMQMAQASKYNLQQTLMGNEAQYMKL